MIQILSFHFSKLRKFLWVFLHQVSSGEGAQQQDPSHWCPQEHSRINKDWLTMASTENFGMGQHFLIIRVTKTMNNTKKHLKSNHKPEKAPVVYKWILLGWRLMQNSTILMAHCMQQVTSKWMWVTAGSFPVSERVPQALN